MPSFLTSTLEISYEDSGPSQGLPILLLHGWPDAPRGWRAVANFLHTENFRTIIPFLRGSQPTRFISAETPRIGSSVALAQDAIDLADALRLDRFIAVGHDWGARTAYTLAALFPERVLAIAALSVAFQPRGLFHVPNFEQSRRFWYQWFQCTEGGVAAIRKDPVAFARIQWDTWSPPGWFDEAEFAATAEAFHHPDWAAITLNAYRSRWIAGELGDPRYAPLQNRLATIDSLSTPALMIQGQSDFCDAPEESKGLESHFSRSYRRVLLDGVGHFPHREAPAPVAEAILEFLGTLQLRTPLALRR
jgi:pimeloyl-ACP methyl ester carboxylesterase